MGKPIHQIGEFKGQIDYSTLGKAISMHPKVVAEHLSLVDVSTPQEVKKAEEQEKSIKLAHIIFFLPFLDKRKYYLLFFLFLNFLVLKAFI